ncbi:MAG: YtxH domain-containing protein [Bacteroidetes bacterium]|jgi:gas vesicle protein|nr:YtxH domain-containing protein [Bacteroidota bacterium]
MKKSSKLFATIAVGSALGMLFAPAKGSDTRKKIEDQAKRLKKLIKKGRCTQEQLSLLKEKIQKQKEGLEKHLEKINSMLAEYETKDT